MSLQNLAIVTTLQVLASVILMTGEFSFVIGNWTGQFDELITSVLYNLLPNPDKNDEADPDSSTISKTSTSRVVLLFSSVWKPDKTLALVFKMTSPKKQYQIMQCCIFPFFLKMPCMFDLFYSVGIHCICEAFVFNYPIISRCTKFVFQKFYDLEMIYILFLPWPKEGFASQKQSRKKNFA